ncbi:restriction endonuclease subunit S [Evansella tamaricis]|uniref:Restriction endonuclease subunit S n=1 Tax=Evansella tamaricis TaxID=2069301 RepID=A0ABS6JDF6_9BACI|nr:restriction endonuclease subunit S [Evansella tamaricis]MBU9710887.1 restriction endonuclease subunit S [Evansella tamaricis]
MQLGDIAIVKTGLVLSRKKAEFEHETKATYNLLTLKNISDDGTIESTIYDKYNSKGLLGDHYFTQIGDVLIRLSYPNTAVYIDEASSGLLIPSYFAIIKVDKRRILPEFLAWYLNSKDVKKEFERFQSGSRIPSTNQNIIKTIPISETSIEKQKVLIDIYKLHLREKELYRTLIEEKEKWFAGLLKQIQHKSEDNHG